MDESRRHGDLTAHEARVLGCLIEKEATTPDAYPLTVNSLRNACNQSTSRNPVMSLTDHDVETALASLRERGWTRVVHSTSNRATKHRHVLPEAIDLDPASVAVVAVLLLRGEQTVGEIKSRTDRQHEFESIDAVADTLDALAGREPPLVQRLERQPGQKDARWVELLSESHDGTLASPNESAASPGLVDPYSTATAEFYDLLATAHWDTFGLQLLDLLEGVDASMGPIVDLGAGTGVALPYIRAAAPGASILAIEPSRAMRTALHTRLHLDIELRQITTVDPRPWATADLPSVACGLVASAVLGHLGVAERERLWRFVSEQMPRGAPAVIEILPPDQPVDIPRTRYRELSVGDFVYEGWLTGEPVDEHSMNWTMEYLVRDGDKVVAESSVRSLWTCLAADEIRAEIAPFGLGLTEYEDCIVVCRPA